MDVWRSHGDIDFGPLDETTLDGAIRCISEVFVENEPMTRHLRITLDEFLHFAHATYPEIAREGLSFVARDQQTGEIIGVRVSEDFAKPPPPEIEGLSDKFFPLFALLESLTQKFATQRSVKPGTYAHLFMVAVRGEYTNRGIAPIMNEIFLRHVIEKGFTHAVTEPTGRISQHVLIKKFGFNPLHRVNYDDFVFEGKRVFKGMEGHDCAMILEKDLSELENQLQARKLYSRDRPY
jgi:ribosomal protein S18 acetylase RimI-like enzyme